ncbi:MAG: hypothetical protein IJS08_03345 [Victivallales bacterium]|nr:hypothetical protein [Victivallales bacterium]
MDIAKHLLPALPLWIILNTYAFLLDAFVLASGAGTYFLLRGGHYVWCLFPGIAFIILLVSAIKLHLSYPLKLKTYYVLYRRNSASLHYDSFKDFMGAPCHRLVVRTVLHRIGHPDEYDVIFERAWGKSLPCCSPKPSEVHIFHNAEEGARWLKEQSSIK